MCKSDKVMHLLEACPWLFILFKVKAKSLESLRRFYRSWLLPRYLSELNPTILSLDYPAFHLLFLRHAKIIPRGPLLFPLTGMFFPHRDLLTCFLQSSVQMILPVTYPRPSHLKIVISACFSITSPCSIFLNSTSYFLIY